MNPRCSNPIRMHTAPDTIAIIPASATARPGSPAESGNTTDRITAASAESGPNTKMRLGPNSAYANSGTMVAYRPLMPGRPDATAYAMPTGTSIVVRTKPAATSFGSQAAWYRRSTSSPGTHRSQRSMALLRAGVPFALLQSSNGDRDLLGR